MVQVHGLRVNTSDVQGKVSTEDSIHSIVTKSSNLKVSMVRVISYHRHSDCIDSRVEKTVFLLKRNQDAIRKNNCV